MARIRTVKPEFWSSPDTASCDDPWARLLFIAMWNWADDEGRGTANAKELGGFAFPNDDKLDTADIRRMLGGIRRAFGVLFYKVDGRPYYAIPSWEKHQKIDRRSAGKYPGPESGEPWDPDPDGSGTDQGERRDSMGPADPSAETHESPPSTRRALGGNGADTARKSAEPPAKPTTTDDHERDINSDVTHVKITDRRGHTPNELPKRPNSAETHEDPPNTRRIPGAGTGEQRNRGTEEKSSCARPESATTDRARTENAHTPPPADEPAPDPHAGANRPRRKRRPSNADRFAQLNETACALPEYKIIDEWKANHQTKYLNKTYFEMRREVKTLLDAKGTHEIILIALRDWDNHDNAAPGLLPYLYADAVKAFRGKLKAVPEQRPVEDIPDTDIDVEELLGPASFTPDITDDIAALPIEAYRAEMQRQLGDWKADRLVQARRELLRRRNRRSETA